MYHSGGVCTKKCPLISSGILEVGLHQLERACIHSPMHSFTHRLTPSEPAEVS